MDFPTNGIAEPSLPEDRSSRHTLPVIVNEDTLRPPKPMIDEDHHPLTWWKETGVGERYIKSFVECFIMPLLNQSGMNLYSLIELLHNDACSLDLNLKLLFQHRTLRRQRVGSRLVNSKIFDLWVTYNDSDMGFSTMDLLLKLSKVHCAKFILRKMLMTKEWN